MEQAVQRSCGFHTPGDVQNLVGWGPEQYDLVDGNWNKMILRSLPTQNSDSMKKQTADQMPEQQPPTSCTRACRSRVQRFCTSPVTNASAICHVVNLPSFPSLLDDGEVSTVLCFSHREVTSC